MKRCLALGAVALLVGCSGSSKHKAVPAGPGKPQSRYNQRMAAIVPALQSKILKSFFALEEVRSPITARAEVRDLATTLKQGAEQIAAVSPPAPIAGAHANLVAAYRRLRREIIPPLTGLARRRVTDNLRVRAGKLRKSPGFVRLGRALEAVVAKGYGLGLRSTG